GAGRGDASKPADDAGEAVVIEPMSSSVDFAEDGAGARSAPRARVRPDSGVRPLGVLAEVRGRPCRPKRNTTRRSRIGEPGRFPAAKS
ncbi:MAG TPA: hypothetical protein VGS58_13150, partial [Candidatus Sulfopaludibacter sp.]|nr:hypothetical protein [Candidatus Sulfopaludibacter sp.]